MSNIKDEIDWEFPGANTTNGQTNFFWQGNIRAFMHSSLVTLVCMAHAQPANKTQGEVAEDISDAYSNYHAFTVRRSGCGFLGGTDPLTRSIGNPIT